MAASASFMPHTNSEQDVLETIFATQLVYPLLPKHVHAKLEKQSPGSDNFSTILLSHADKQRLLAAGGDVRLVQTLPEQIIAELQEGSYVDNPSPALQKAWVRMLWNRSSEVADWKAHGGLN
jgi:hypothetical protein